jgi:hypothetical protein
LENLNDTADISGIELDRIAKPQPKRAQVIERRPINHDLKKSA